MTFRGVRGCENACAPQHWHKAIKIAMITAASLRTGIIEATPCAPDGAATQQSLLLSNFATEIKKPLERLQGEVTSPFEGKKLFRNKLHCCGKGEQVGPGTVSSIGAPS